MKKRSALWVLLVLALSLSLGVNALAAGSVTYDENANEFIFAPGTEQSPTSLFENFQNVMPGDTLSEQIRIFNDSAKGVKIKLYMRALGAQEGTEDFLSQMNLTVQQQEASVLFDAPADETAQLTDWVCLGTIYSGGEITLDVQLEVPLTMDNSFQNRIGYLDWQFKIEEFPVEPTDPKPPQTGDSGGVFLYVGLMLLSLTALVILLFFVKPKKEN